MEAIGIVESYELSPETILKCLDILLFGDAPGNGQWRFDANGSTYVYISRTLIALNTTRRSAADSRMHASQR